MAGPRRDGYGVRPRRCRAFSRIPRAGRPCGPRGVTHSATLRSNRRREHETVASQATLGRKTVHRGRLCFIRAATRPCTALREGRRVPRHARCCDKQQASGPTRRSPSMVMRSCAWAGCGANKAQALAAGDSATQHGFSRATVSCSRKLFDRSEAQGVFSRGSRGLPAQGIRLEVRKHRGRTP